jgi:hypothetical protein
MGRHWGGQWGDEYPHRDVTEAIILAAIKVQRIIGLEVGLPLNFHNWPL